MITEIDESFFSHITADEEKEKHTRLWMANGKAGNKWPTSKESVPATVEVSRLCCKTCSLGTQSPPLTHLSWRKKKCTGLPIPERIKYKVACMCFSAVSGSGPAYLSELLHVYTPSRTLTLFF